MNKPNQASIEAAKAVFVYLVKEGIYLDERQAEQVALAIDSVTWKSEDRGLPPILDPIFGHPCDLCICGHERQQHSKEMGLHWKGECHTCRQNDPLDSSRCQSFRHQGDSITFTREELKAINDAASDLCKSIEEIPASPEQTALSMKASNVLHPINRKLYPH